MKKLLLECRGWHTTTPLFMKMFMLLTLVVGSVNGAWADDVVFGWRMSGTDAPTNGNSIGESTNWQGTITFNSTDDSKSWSVESASYRDGVDNNYKAEGENGLKAGYNALYIKIELTGGKTFKSGDVITICGYNSWKIGTSQSSLTNISGGLNTGNAKNDYAVASVTIPKGIESSTIYLARAQGSSTGIASFDVKRPSSASYTVTWTNTRPSDALDAWFTLGDSETQYRETQTNVPAGTKVVYHANDAGSPGYAINGWRENGTTGNTGWLKYGNTYTIEAISSNLDIVAEWQGVHYFDAAVTGTGGSAIVYTNSETKANISGQKVMNWTTSATWEAIPNAGYEFTQWEDGNTSNPRTESVSYEFNHHTTHTATFQVASGTYHITITKNGPGNDVCDATFSYTDNEGVVHSDLREADVPAGASLTFTSTVSGNYLMNCWNIDGVNKYSNSVSGVVVSKNMTVNANFTVGYVYTSSVPEGNGSISMHNDGGNYYFNSGTRIKNYDQVTVTAIPNQGYKFKAWGNGSTENPVVLTYNDTKPTEDVGFIAYFEVDPDASGNVLYSDNCSTNVWKTTGGASSWIQDDEFIRVQSETTANGNRNVYTEFDPITSETIYSVDFDFRIKDANNADRPSIIAIMAGGSLPAINAVYSGANLLTLTQTEAKSTSYTINNGNTVSLSQDKWYNIKVVINEKHVILKITDKTAGTTQDEEYDLTSSLKVSGIIINVDRNGRTVADFDNIRVSSPQSSLGSVLRPTIEVTGVYGKDREVTIEAGKTDSGLPVTTYYSLDGGTNWQSFTGTSTTIELKSESPATANIVAYSAIEDYAVVESERATLDVDYGKAWVLEADFRITNMTDSDSPSITFKDGTTHKYYTPVLQVVAKTGVLPIGTPYTVTVEYDAYEYATTYKSNGERNETRPNVTWTEMCATGISNGSDYVSSALQLPESGLYRIKVEANGYTTGITQHLWYKAKYKKTYSRNYTSYNNLPTVDTEAQETVYNEITKRERYDCQSNWKQVDAIAIDGWNGSYTDYAWQVTRPSTSASLDRHMTGKSNAMEEWYDFRTTQTDLNNPIFLRDGYGLMKNASVAWNYRGAQANIGECNEIGMLVYQDANHNTTTVYDIPGYHTESGVPEVYFDVPAYNAVVEYQVFTPVDTKDVGNTGLASFASYYPLYAIADYYMENDEYIDAYRTTGRNVYGKMYYLDQCWYLKQREGLLWASTAFRGSQIWNTESMEQAKSLFGSNGKTIEMRIIPEFYFDGNTIWKGTNEFLSVLAPADEKNNTSWYYQTTGSVDGTENSAPNLILHTGTTYGVDNCVNFYSVPNPDDKVRLKHMSAILQMRTTTFKVFADMHAAIPGNNASKIAVLTCFGEVDDDIETAIENTREQNAITENNDVDIAYYTLSGVKVTKPTKGLYIHAGKKVLIK